MAGYHCLMPMASLAKLENLNLNLNVDPNLNPNLNVDPNLNPNLNLNLNHAP